MAGLGLALGHQEIYRRCRVQCFIGQLLDDILAVRGLSEDTGDTRGDFDLQLLLDRRSVGA